MRTITPLILLSILTLALGCHNRKQISTTTTDNEDLTAYVNPFIGLLYPLGWYSSALILALRDGIVLQATFTKIASFQASHTHTSQGRVQATCTTYK